MPLKNSGRENGVLLDPVTRLARNWSAVLNLKGLDLLQNLFHRCFGTIPIGLKTPRNAGIPRHGNPTMVPV